MTQAMPTTQFSSAHFIGIGGAGMSGIARVLFERGCTVTGSDLKNSHYVRDLEELGIDIRIGHRAQTIDELAPDVVVISTAIPETNPELARARELHIPVWRRAQMLAALGEGATTIAVAGTHGKTTTSSLVATVLDHLGCDPSFLIGGIVEEYHTNGRNGSGGYFVCEADESDGSFLFLHPHVVVVTNIEADHLDHYGTLENIEKAFCEFMDLVGEDGTVIIFGDNPHYVELAQSTGRHTVTYGFSEGVDYRCIPHESTGGLQSFFDVECADGRRVQSGLHANPGKHNMANATAAVAVADVLGLDVVKAASAVAEFKGAHRRFTHVGDAAGITIVDDYGHHPTEVNATLTAAAQLGFKRVVCVFQPHRFSRTQALAHDFATAFNKADVLVVTDVFSAGEMPIPGVSGKTISNAVKSAGDVVEVFYQPSRRKIVDTLLGLCRPGDLVITQGAGDITQIGPELLSALQKRERKGVQKKA